MVSSAVNALGVANGVHTVPTWTAPSYAPGHSHLYHLRTTIIIHIFSISISHSLSHKFSFSFHHFSFSLFPPLSNVYHHRNEFKFHIFVWIVSNYLVIMWKWIMMIAHWLHKRWRAQWKKCVVIWYHYTSSHITFGHSLCLSHVHLPVPSHYFISCCLLRHTNHTSFNTLKGATLEKHTKKKLLFYLRRWCERNIFSLIF